MSGRKHESQENEGFRFLSNGGSRNSFQEMVGMFSRKHTGHPGVQQPPPDIVNPAPSSTFPEREPLLLRGKRGQSPGVLCQLENRGLRGWGVGGDPGGARKAKSTHPAFCRIPSSTGICFIIWGSERFHLNNQLFPCNITERHDHAVSRFWVRRKEPRGESPPSAAR